MKWRGQAKSSNVEDRRGVRPGRAKRRTGRISIVGIILVIIYSVATGEDPTRLLSSMDSGQSSRETYQPNAGSGKNEELAEFSKVVLKYTEDVWAEQFRTQLGKRYVAPKMVIFNDFTNGACGQAGKATGPYYCPADQTIYMDLVFLKELGKEFGAPGDFAAAYVIAHEVGHHIQYLLGTLQQVQSQRNRLSEKEYNKLSVKLELQADFYAGMWAHHADRMKDILEPGDIEEALGIASAIGDDRIQKKAYGYIVPDAFTHGSSAQRVKWFKRGFQYGSFEYANTFK